MERRINQYAPDILHNFVQAAQKDGAIDRLRKARSRKILGTEFDTTARRLNVIGLLLGTRLIQSEMGEMQGITRKAVNKTIKDGFIAIWSYCSIPVKANFPYVSIINVPKSKPIRRGPSS